MQELLIQSLEIDWSEIDARDYLRSIHAIQAIERLEFHSPVTFFAGENGSGKSTLLEAIAVAQGFNPEGGTKNYSFSTYDSHSGLAEALRLVRGARRAKWGYFCEQKVFTMWQHRKKTMQNCSACQRAITENRMARVFWHWHRRSSARKGCIC